MGGLGRRATLGVALALTACAGGSEDVDPDARVVAAPVAAPAPAPALLPAGDAVGVRTEFVGVGRQYQGYFSDPSAMRALGEALSVCFPSEAFLQIAYDDEARLGRIVVRVEPGASPCRPVPTPEGWDLSPATPITVALAAYRDTLASRYDFRLASFQIGVAYRGGSEVCTLWAGGSHPPDGTAFSPCVEVRGGERCLPGADAGVLSLAPRGQRRRLLRTCLGG